MSWRWDSNPQPADYKSAALPIELHQHIKFYPYPLGVKKPLYMKWFLVGEDGFEPSKSKTTDLQSAPFGRSGTLPCVRDKQKLIPVCGAGDGTRTRDLLITNQLLYQLSYTSIIFKNII